MAPACVYRLNQLIWCLPSAYVLCVFDLTMLFVARNYYIVGCDMQIALKGSGRDQIRTSIQLLV